MTTLRLSIVDQVTKAIQAIRTADHVEPVTDTDISYVASYYADQILKLFNGPGDKA